MIIELGQAAAALRALRDATKLDHPGLRERMVAEAAAAVERAYVVQNNQRAEAMAALRTAEDLRQAIAELEAGGRVFIPDWPKGSLNPGQRDAEAEMERERLAAGR